MRDNWQYKYGKWAIITGGCSGIGLGFAEKLAGRGLNLILVSNNYVGLRDAISKLKLQYPIEAVACCTDLADANFMDDIEAIVGDKEIGFLVNAASFGQLEPFYDTKIKRHIDCIHVGINAYVLLTHRFLSSMKHRNRGAVVFVASVNAFSPVGYSSVYTATKAFELSFGQALWKELKDESSKIDCLVLCPAATKTNFQSAAGTKVAKWAWTPERVVKKALSNLGKQPQVITTWRGNAYYLITKWLPRRLGIHFATWAINSNLKREVA